MPLVGASAELVDVAAKMRLAGAGRHQFSHLCVGPPSPATELPIVEIDGRCTARRGEEKPETDVDVGPHPVVVDGFGHRDEARPPTESMRELGVQTEFLAELTSCGLGRVLVCVDMASGGEPQTGQPMVDEEDGLRPLVDDGTVRDQVFGRSRRFGDPIQRSACIDPIERVAAMGTFERIVRLDRIDRRAKVLSCPVGGAGAGLAQRRRPSSSRTVR